MGVDYEVGEERRKVKKWRIYCLRKLAGGRGVCLNMRLRVNHQGDVDRTGRSDYLVAYCEFTGNGVNRMSIGGIDAWEWDIWQRTEL